VSDALLMHLLLACPPPWLAFSQHFAQDHFVLKQFEKALNIQDFKFSESRFT
jgi:hypothetical protein